MNMDENYYVGRVTEDVVWEKIEEETFIIVTKDGKEKVIKLNRTAGFLWEHCDGTETIEGLAEKLYSKFDIDETKALDDTKKFIDNMKKAHLLAMIKPV